MTAVPAETRERQRRATDPDASAFVSANAGSGKTFVLSRRVIRLMMAGCEPGRILCLTFTKAAAAEMANRVFAVLGRWATVDGETLAAEIADMEGGAPDGATLDHARRLFARALETPGGLKVQTIHAFAEALLQRFSVEANLSGRFEVLDDRGAALLRSEARDRMVRDTAEDPASPVATALADLIAVTSDDAVDRALHAMVDDREAFLAWIARHGSLDRAIESLPAALGVPAGWTDADVDAAVTRSADFDGAFLSDLIPVLDGAGVNSVKLADGFRAALAADGKARAEAWTGLFCKDDGAAKSATTAIVKAVEAALPGTRERFEREAERIAGLMRIRSGIETSKRTAAIARLADRVIGHYQAGKAARGTLDYDDLILRAALLLSRSDAAAWVQYKLDEGLDHILVDEAQDTSPAQWDIVQALSGDFFSGAGARGKTVRTLFAVGDEKQSIYSFQGAAPHLFGHARASIGHRVKGAGGTFHGLELTVSFRSAPDVVKGVDRVFATAAAHAGLTLDPRPTVHETVRTADPGLVEVWPETEAEKAPEPERWEDPVDRTGRGSADVVLAERIADEIAGWIRSGETIAATGAPIRPGDVLVLVRKRGAFVEAVNRAMKARGLPVAGADRLDVIGHIVVRDLLAAARAALLPEDDLTVAAVAKSPLVGMSEEELFALAHGRGDAGLAKAAEAAGAAGGTAAARLVDRLTTWGRRAGSLEPHSFFAAIAGPDGARAAYRARFGREADEVIDEFLTLVLAFEERETGTLQGLVCRLEGMREEVKRDVEGGRDEVRVMTVHGAKGLEAPIVFLVDPGDAPASGHHAPAVVLLGDEAGAAPVWVQAGLKPRPVEAELDRHRIDQEAEYRRLLYVGLTRARDRLIVAGIRRDKVRPDGRWHTLVRSALETDAEVMKGPGGAVERWIWRIGGGAGGGTGARTTAGPPRTAPAPLPAWATARVPAEPATRTLTPSSAAEHLTARTTPLFRRDPLAAARSLDDEASRRGRLTHRLFEVLPDIPVADRAARAAAWLAREAADLDDPAREAILATVTAVMTDPARAALFGPGSRAEIGIAGDLVAPDGTRVAVSGQIDRMLVTETEILVVDFKTNRVVPDAVPPAYVAQLALYHRLLGERSAGRTIRCAILWTETGHLDEVAASVLDRTVAEILTNMGSGGGGRRS